MFKLGEYCEDEARSIVKHLKGAKIKVEQRTFICSSVESNDYIEGRQSELRSVVKDIETYEEFLGVLKTALARGTNPDDFKDVFLNELDPGWADRKERLAEVVEESPGTSVEGMADGEVAEDSCKPKLEDRDLERLAKSIVAYDFAMTTLSRNEIEPGEDVGNRLDDPILRIRVNEEDYEDSDLLRNTVSVFLKKRSELFVDEFTTPLFDDLDDEFEENFPEEHLRIMTLGMLITDLVEEPSPGKIDMQAFSERCVIEMEKEGDMLQIDGEEAADEIARGLEKNGIIKVKGETIKWRS